MSQYFKKMVLAVVVLVASQVVSIAQEVSNKFLHGVWVSDDITRSDPDGKKKKIKLALMFVDDGNFKLGLKPENEKTVEHEGRYEVKGKQVVIRIKDIGTAQLDVNVIQKDKIHLKSTAESTVMKDSSFELTRLPIQEKGKESPKAPSAKNEEPTKTTPVKREVWESLKLVDEAQDKKFVRQIEFRGKEKLALDEIWEDGTVKGSWTMTYKIDGNNLKVYNLDGSLWADAEIKLINDKAFVMIFDNGVRHVYNMK